MTPGACDTHLHFYDGRYPAAPDSVLFPPDATPEDYRKVQQALGTNRVVVVQPTTYGLDNRCQLEAMKRFGDDARGVMVVDSRTPVSTLRAMTDAGVVGARFHMLPGGAVAWDQLEPTAAAIEPFGWHIQLQLDGNTLDQHLDRLLSLPVDLVIDHIGRFMPPPALPDRSVDALLRLVDTGRTWVKLSAPYESIQSPDHSHDGVQPLIARLVTEAPERLLWASNWPHPGQTNPPTAADLLGLLDRWLPTESLRRRVLVDNPAVRYSFQSRTPRSES